MPLKTMTFCRGVSWCRNVTLNRWRQIRNFESNRNLATARVNIDKSFRLSSPSVSVLSTTIPLYHQPVRWHTEEADGIGSRTTVEIINRPQVDEEGNQIEDNTIFIQSFSETGFQLTNKFRIIGPCILFPRTVLRWNVGSARDITPESLALFSLLEPKLDLLVVGTGDGSVPCDALPIIQFCRKQKINVEILQTEEACATFNFLNSEQRMVAAALIPPEVVSLFTQEDYVTEETFNLKEDETWDSAAADDHTHPRNIDKPQEWFDQELSMQRGHWVKAAEGREIRYTEAKMEKEMAAMEDRYSESGKRLATELDLEAKKLMEADLLKVEEKGEVSMRVQHDITGSTDFHGPLGEELEEKRDIVWPDIEESRRVQKKFDRLYDVGQYDGTEERRHLAQENEKPKIEDNQKLEIESGEEKTKSSDDSKQKNEGS